MRGERPRAWRGLWQSGGNSAGWLNDVEIALHDTFFAPYSLDKDSVVGLYGFAPHTSSMGKETVFGRLLTDGAAASAFLARPGIDIGLL